MSPELLIEVALYITFLVGVLLFRRSSISKGTAARVETKRSCFEPKKTKPKSNRKQSSNLQAEPANWRKVMMPPASRICSEAPKLVIDVRKAFDVEKSGPDFSYQELQVPPPPPPSPVNQSHFGLDPSFTPFIEEHCLLEEPVSDMDHERRRKYIKKQVTDGEVMLTVREKFHICQIFVFGIEYHYVYVPGELCAWELPAEIKTACGQWYLSLPRAKQKKYMMEKPPDPLCHDNHVQSQPSFSPLGVYS